jgi:hypothetical protein
MSQAEQRQAIITEAKTWQGTPWHHQGNIKGVGVDCGQILIEVFATCFPEKQIRLATDELQYSRQWMLHRDEERYLAVVERYAQRVETPLMGDIAVWKVGRTYSHGAIVIDYPQVIHAHTDEGVVITDVSCCPLATLPVLFFSVFSRG